MTTTTRTAEDFADVRAGTRSSSVPGRRAAMAARELAIGGAAVLLVERPFPREKVCGGCLNGHAWQCCRPPVWGPCRAGRAALLADRSGSASGAECGPAWLPAGVAVSRARFDAELVDAAVDAGVRFLPRTEARVGAVEGPGRLVHLRSRADRPGERRPGRHGARPLGFRPAPPRGRASARVADRDGLPAGRRSQPTTTWGRSSWRWAGPVMSGLVRLGDGSLHIAGGARARRRA